MTGIKLQIRFFFRIKKLDFSMSFFFKLWKLCFFFFEKNGLDSSKKRGKNHIFHLFKCWGEKELSIDFKGKKYKPSSNE